MRRKAYGFKVAGQTAQGSARLAILGKDYVTTKRLVNHDIDRTIASYNKQAMRAALVGWSDDDLSKVATKGEYKASKGQTKKATAMPMNFWRGTGFGS
jgi:hypothetical protein